MKNINCFAFLYLLEYVKDKVWKSIYYNGSSETFNLSNILQPILVPIFLLQLRDVPHNLTLHSSCAFHRGNFSLIKILPIVVSIRRVRLLWSVTRAISSALVLFSARVYPSCSYPNQLCATQIMVFKVMFLFRHYAGKG